MFNLIHVHDFHNYHYKNREQFKHLHNSTISHGSTDFDMKIFKIHHLSPLLLNSELA
jgi:hypothetical protein